MLVLTRVAKNNILLTEPCDETLLDKGYDYLSQIIIQNLEDFKTIMEWNEANGFNL